MHAAARLQHALQFRHYLLRISYLFQHCIAFYLLEPVVLERQQVRIRHKVDARRQNNIEVAIPVNLSAGATNYDFHDARQAANGSCSLKSTDPTHCAQARQERIFTAQRAREAFHQGNAPPDRPHGHSERFAAIVRARNGVALRS